MSHTGPRPVHALYCKCGIQFHIASLAHALTDAAWQRGVRQCLKAGGREETFDLNDKEPTLYKGVCVCGYVKCCTQKAIDKEANATGRNNAAA